MNNVKDKNVTKVMNFEKGEERRRSEGERRRRGRRAHTNGKILGGDLRVPFRNKYEEIKVSHWLFST